MILNIEWEKTQTNNKYRNLLNRMYIESEESQQS